MNNFLNWIFMKWFWIEYWIESILRKIQTLNWINLGIEQGYSRLNLSALTSRKIFWIFQTWTALQASPILFMKNRTCEKLEHAISHSEARAFTWKRLLVIVSFNFHTILYALYALSVSICKGEEEGTPFSEKVNLNWPENSVH